MWGKVRRGDVAGVDTTDTRRPSCIITSANRWVCMDQTPPVECGNWTEVWNSTLITRAILSRLVRTPTPHSTHRSIMTSAAFVPVGHFRSCRSPEPSPNALQVFSSSFYPERSATANHWLRALSLSNHLQVGPAPAGLKGRPSGVDRV